MVKLNKEEFNEHIFERINNLISDYELIKEGELIAVALSGGKDSVLTLHALKRYQEFLDYDLVAISVDEGIKGYRSHGIDAAVNNAKDLGVELIQKSFYEDEGLYTGEISPKMLKSIGVEYVIIGHSERRQYFAETDETVNKKIKAALKNELKPIVCVGETLEQREAGKTEEIITMQTKLALEGLTSQEVNKIIIAYEPIWAIGTGKTATSEDANNSIKAIRNEIANLYGSEVADEIIIQYGGSVKSSNAKELFNTSDIDGGLVGGASLKVDEFAKIVNF